MSEPPRGRQESDDLIPQLRRGANAENNALNRFRRNLKEMDRVSRATENGR
jgi:hypothetical protein